MNLCVFGAGAIGGHLAVRLAQHAGHRVEVVARGPHLAAIRERGLELRIVDTRLHANLHASDNVRELGDQDAVLVTLKAHAIPAAADDLAYLARHGAALVFVANGIPWWYAEGAPRAVSDATRRKVDPAGLHERFDLRRVVGGVVQSPNTMIEPGVIYCASTTNRLSLGPPHADQTAATAAVAQALQDAGIDALRSADIRVDVWRKLLLNASLSPLCALIDDTGKAVTRDADLHRLCLAILREVVAVARAHGVTFDVDEGVLDEARLPNHKSSMAQDLAAGRPLETDAILVAAQALARDAGVETPSLDIVSALIRARARQ